MDEQTNWNTMTEIPLFPFNSNIQFSIKYDIHTVTSSSSLYLHYSFPKTKLYHLLTGLLKYLLPYLPKFAITSILSSIVYKQPLFLKHLWKHITLTA